MIKAELSKFVDSFKENVKEKKEKKNTREIPKWFLSDLEQANGKMKLQLAKVGDRICALEEMRNRDCWSLCL